jgi:tetratricopeptide (TPR) repeat protein
VIAQRGSELFAKCAGEMVGVFKTLFAGAAFLLLIGFLLSACSTTASTDSPKVVPKPPANVQVTFSAEGLSVTWKPVPRATHYTVFWGKEESRFRHLQDTRGCAMEISGLQQGEKYSVAVTAWNQRGESDLSEKRMVVYDNDAAKSSHYVALGKESMERGRLDDAEAYFNAAVRLAPENPEAYRSRSRFYRKIARSDLAKQDSRLAKQLQKKKSEGKKPGPHWDTAAGSR